MPNYEVQVSMHGGNNNRAFSHSDARCCFLCAAKPVGTSWGLDDNTVGLFKIFERVLTDEEKDKLFLHELAFNKDDLSGPFLVPVLADHLLDVSEE